MVRNRLPTAVARATGANIKNPARFAGRNDPASPLIGQPSRWMRPCEKRAWKLFVAELPWLVEADRAMLELACGLRGPMFLAKGISISSIQVYSAILSKLGASPVDRSRTQPIGNDAPRDEFFDD